MGVPGAFLLVRRMVSGVERPVRVQEIRTGCAGETLEWRRRLQVLMAIVGGSVGRSRD